MNITLIFFLGLIVALIGVVPPGLLNISAAKISLKEGHVRGIMFSIGVCVIVLLQTYLASIFARYISNHPEIIEILQRAALVIFILITIYYLFIAKDKSNTTIEPQIKSKQIRFFKLILFSSIKFFKINIKKKNNNTLEKFGWCYFIK